VGVVKNKADTEDDAILNETARNSAVDSWLVNEVASAYDALKANPSLALSTNEVRARLREIQLNQAAEKRL
jgi:hypothetical protein